MDVLTGIILTGGKSLRMNGKDKGLISLYGMPLYQHVLRRLKPQVNNIIINANRNINIYKSSGYAVIQDSFKNVSGPLCGIISSFNFINTDWAVFCPCDTPNIPLNFVEKLLKNKHIAPILWVRSKIRDHPTMVLINRKIIKLYKLKENDLNKYNLIDFFKRYGGYPILFIDSELLFYNINTQIDLKNYKNLYKY
ncbi:molybdenum cofactor guanylyltransferase [Candidatus Pantoea edessiphila]|uniref:Molybdenum cofactor guanylyltransferase n=1 Tax=Candidatus Pantoea edessiphila TaxID=2044610 RepID=A0A2P5SXM1_9GAMM|nr:molybdenum cofactor guanylyltransferase MobA [Candidatus Pantoea edessiphila]MBK4775943.1 molybdenum cofactor guanylyltransferase [Pantoea sp. Edef]PPI87053.1 molybdenum cofactor guanylyltransferase [Candidatus Pantoea edessiphila]